MKIRTVALGLVLSAQDFVTYAGQSALLAKLQTAAKSLAAVGDKLIKDTGFEVQTMRIYCNTFEEWLLPLLLSPYNLTLEAIVKQLDDALASVNIGLCSIGSCHSDDAIALVPKILALSGRISCSAVFHRNESHIISVDHAKCIRVAQTCLAIAKECGDLGNFRFCASFQCPDGIPFFPAAYRTAHHNDSDRQPLLTIGLESGDAVYQAYYGIPETCGSNPPHKQARESLRDIMMKACLSIQRAALVICEERGIIYGGIDASINPGLAPVDSVGAGLESLLPPVVAGQERLHCFGAMGTLATVSTTTMAIKSLVNSAGDVFNNGYQCASAYSEGIENSAVTVAAEHVKLVGYSGLMLPVMEDVILAQRATEGRYNMRDLLTFSAVCGVGLDTVPIPGNTSAETLAGVYQEVATLAFRLNKPLSCRVLPMNGKQAGEMTDVVSPYLCNTTVFAIP